VVVAQKDEALPSGSAESWTREDETVVVARKTSAPVKVDLSKSLASIPEVQEELSECEAIEEIGQSEA
jgi:hypothetical protein